VFVYILNVTELLAEVFVGGMHLLNGVFDEVTQAAEQTHAGDDMAEK